MPLQRTKAQGSGLGKALINRKAKEAVAPKESQLYTLDESNPLQSVTHERDLDEFLANAALADQDFTTERTKLRIVAAPNMPSPSTNPFLLNAQQEKDVAKKRNDMSSELRVPRRPPWTRQTTRLELEKQERESFLDWRRDLAQLADKSNLLMTPFERNIQLWRQLWRVLERSHLVVQIVDARNPLNFRCADLETYVKEIGSEQDSDEITVPGKGKRKSLLLINKADLLTLDQRLKWADYFDQHGISYAFFSAANAAALQEQAERQRQRQEELEAEKAEREANAQDEDDREGSISGEEVEPQSDDDDEDVESEDEDEAEEAALARQVQDTKLDSEEEGWSTEGEQEDDAPAGPAETKLAQGESVPLSDVAADIAATHGSGEADEPEDDRTRVLSVTELEDLFLSSAPDIKEFATPRDPNPEKLMVGLVGYPNVGKSSTINALLGAKKVSVSATPGKTKHFQTLVLSDTVTLCDCPGLVFPQFANTQADMVVDGVLPIDQMREYSAPVDLLCRRIPRDIIEGTYGIRIDVREVEEGGTGKVGWEEMLSTYAIARGMTRSSFGMPDTSRAARYVLKDYVNAKLLYAHPPPGQDPDEFMKISRERTLAKIEEAYENGRKRAPVTHVSKNADTFVRPAASSAGQAATVEDSEETAEQEQQKRERQLTTKSVRASAASAPMRSGREKAAALDHVYFAEGGPGPRLVVKGRNQQGDVPEGGHSFARQTVYPHQRMLGPDGLPMMGRAGPDMDGGSSKKHFKRKEGKKRSGRGYD